MEISAASSTLTGEPPVTRRDHGFHQLRVREVVRETSEASSLVLDVPEELKPIYEYRAGQFLTFRLVIDGEPVTRSYSMSSSPDADGHLQVTIKRTAGGRVSNWVNDNLRPGDLVEASAPAGRFTLAPGSAPVVLFAAGSGITPVFSLLKTVLATTARTVRLLYGNRDADSVIFGSRIDELVAAHAGRAAVEHHLETDRGFIDADTVTPYVSGADTEYYICGPTGFMEVVEQALLAAGVDDARIHVERFLPAEEQEAPAPAVEGTPASTVEIDLYGKVVSGDHREGTTILQTARSFGVTPPYGCEAGNCGSCMAMLKEGEVTMYVNDALTDDEVEEGWILTCQAVPTSACVRVSYE